MTSKDVQFVRLERRVLHLERKLVVWASRMKKEVIWRKFLEDWILQKFNFDLRLQVELKTLEEDGVDEFEKYESGEAPATVQSFAQKLPTLQKRPPRPYAISRSGDKLNKRIPQGVQVQINPTGTAAAGPGSIQNVNSKDLPHCSTSPASILRNVSITVVNKSTESVANQMNHLPSVPRQGQSVPSKSFATARSSQQKFTNSGAHGSPLRKRPRLLGSPRRPAIVHRQVTTVTSPPHPIIVSTSSMASGNPSQQQQLQSERSVMSTATTNVVTQPPELILLDDDDEPPQQPLPTSRTTNSSNVISSTIQSQQPIDGGNNSSQGSHSQAINQPHPHHTQPNQQARQLPLQQHPVTSTNNSFGAMEDLLLDSSISNVELNRNYIHHHHESAYVAGGYLQRYGDSGEKIAFDIKKILQHQDPFITDNILTDLIKSQFMSQQTKKNITSAIGDFLMTVYGDNPPRVAKECMAESLGTVFPFTSKDIWWHKIPNKNPAGCIENRIQNKRRQILDERKRQLSSESQMVNPGSYSQQPSAL